MRTHLPKLLLCDDDKTFQLAVRHALKNGFEVQSAYNPDEAFAMIRNRKFDILLLDVQMRTPRDGLDAIQKIREIDSDLSIVMLSGLKDFNVVREALVCGATDYLVKDFDPEELSHSLNRILERKRLICREEQQNYECARSHEQNVLIGESPCINALRRLIEKIRNSDANILIFGETGTGKEVVARQLRGRLPNGTLAPFVAIDSATIHGNTAESILFGHEKGAFTGADKTKKGIFEEANGGTVYFDEIANMSLEIQAKLLRVIQEKEVTRMGSSRSIALEFRVIAATNRDLEEMSKLRLFKDDLLQRLNVIPITLEPLRNRREDIQPLLDHFLKRHSKNASFQLTDSAIEAFKQYDWPGNVRELSNVISFLIATSDREEIDLPDLPPKFRDTLSGHQNHLTRSFYERVEEFESRLLNEEYAKYKDNLSQMALQLGMDRSHLHTKLRLYGIHSPKIRSQS
jgi:two-component system response regulator HydG